MQFSPPDGARLHSLKAELVVLGLARLGSHVVSFYMQYVFSFYVYLPESRRQALRAFFSVFRRHLLEYVS